MPPSSLLRRLAAFTVALLALGLISAHAAETPAPDVVGTTTAVQPVVVALPTTQLFPPAPFPDRPRATRQSAPQTTDAPATTLAPPISTTTPPPTAPAPPPTTTPPPPTTTTPPPPTAPAPAPAPAPSETLQQKVERAYVAGVPKMWRDAITVELSVIEGRTSWAEGGGAIMIARSHAEGRFEHLADVVAHEFGHQVAFEFGTRDYPGAAPAGWPAPANNPAEAWADCVQLVFTGRSNPSHGLAACAGEQRSWASDWLSSVPVDPSA